ncbi:MAG: hypothetical protein LUG16_06340, partial [Candidatus Gastranaerophilales bacterium]|nr:hypothetical protein [Candidatus Gastranaerophilales bacterium]
YNIEIKTLLEEIKAILPESKYSILLNSQTTWSNFIESDNLSLDTILESEIYFEPYLISSGIKYQNKKHRYEELITLYKYLNIN